MTSIEDKTFEELEIKLEKLEDYWCQDYHDVEVVRVYCVRWNKKKQEQDFITLPKGWKRIFVPCERLLQVIDYLPQRIFIQKCEPMMYQVIKYVRTGTTVQMAKHMCQIMGFSDLTVRGVVKHKDGGAFEILMQSGKKI